MRLFGLALVFVIPACSASVPRAAACAPVPAEMAAAVPAVYRDCQVDRQAKPIGQGARLNYTPTPATRCARVSLEVVVDSTGRVLPKTVRVVRSTNPEFLNAVLGSLEGLRYEPAQRGGRPVAQVVLHNMALTTRVVVMGATEATRRTASRPAC